MFLLNNYFLSMTLLMQLSAKNWNKLPQTQIFYASNCPLSTTPEADVFLAQTGTADSNLAILALKLYKNCQKPSSIIEQLIGHRFQNVIQFYEVSQSNTSFCLMEFCGKNLRQYKLSRNQIHRSQQILAIARQIIHGLIQLKQLRIIHADIKPQNLLMSHQENVKICDLDFVITEKCASEKKLRVGTFEYMAPEILQEGRCSYKSDIWSLGILLYQLYFGNHPFPNLCRSTTLEEQSFKQGYKTISVEIETLRKKVVQVRDCSQSQQIMFLMNLMLYCLNMNLEQRKTLQQLENFIQKPNKLRRMSHQLNSHTTEKHEESSLYNNETLLNMFQNLLLDLKHLPRNDILLKKAKQLQLNLQNLKNCMLRQNQTNKSDFLAFLQKFKLQSRKVSSIIENNLKRLGGGSQKMVNYQEKIHFAEHLQLANSFVSSHSSKGKGVLRQGFYSTEQLSQTR